MIQIPFYIALVQFWLIQRPVYGQEKSQEKSQEQPASPLGLLGQALGKGLAGGRNMQIALKVMPSKKMRMTKSDLNSLLMDLKAEVRRQVSQLEEQYAQQVRFRQKTSDDWVEGGAPVFIPDAYATRPKQAPLNTQTSVNTLPPSTAFPTYPEMAFKEIDQGGNGTDKSMTSSVLMRSFAADKPKESEIRVEKQSETTTNNAQSRKLRNGPLKFI